MEKISTRLIEKYDRSQMREKLETLYTQFQTPLETLNPKALPKADKIKNVVITGLGGSAIGGDLVRTYLSDECTVPIVVNRNYTLPEFVSSSSLVIVSSYSGNTEETISAYKQAIEKKAKICCISSGGAVLKLAKTHHHYTLKLPEGYPPRTAIGFLFSAMLRVLTECQLIADKTDAIAETASYLQHASLRYADFKDEQNLAIELARKSVGKMPLIYTSDDFTSGVGLRWKGQICENAKILAYTNTLPELNHNELVGWKLNENLLKRMHVIFLHDRDDHPRTAIRMHITHQMIRKYTKAISHVESEGNSLLTRIFSLVLLGDWMSYYLALMQNIDPTPVKAINQLKEALQNEA
ncbi:MAG: bifunctional phosphoglucose/phosphomannose isomerase [Chloroherpetonaceae bacterium]|nr:bifunctional phosphoglucose/phosphomannose isomerase [Chloroherpetonaceae bacterium]